MGCDVYANKQGVFEIVVTDYQHPKRFDDKVIRIENLDEDHKIQVEVTEGNER